MKTDTLFFKSLNFLLFLSLSSVNLYGGWGGLGGGGGSSEGDEKQFDCWDYWIDDDSLPENEDRNISTKIVNQVFQLSLAAIESHNNDYEKKDANDSNADNSVEIAIWENKDNGIQLSNAIKFDPTEDDQKHIDKSADLKVTQASKDAIVGIRMCAEIDDKHYIIHNFDDCSGSNQSCDDDTNDAQFVICYASNNFAIRPKKFQIEQQEYLISGQDYNLSVIAEDGNGDATQEYTLTNADVNSAGGAASVISKLINSWTNGGTNTDTKDYNLSLEIEKYMPNDDINSSLYGEGNVTLYRFDNGDASDDTDDKYVDVYYTDVGKVNLLLLDQNWSDVDKDDTPDGCSNEDGKNMGRYVCGDINVTYIPDHFSITNKIKIYDHNDSIFTYIAEDYNMSAHIEIDIEALNIDGNLDKNFDIDSWVNPMTIDFKTSNEVDINKSIISDMNLSFQEGKLTIKWNEENLSKNLLFNYKREVNSARNPFIIKADDINISILSQYSDINISDDNGTTIGGDESNATFLFARTNIPRTRFVKNNSYNINIYYETFCYATDTYNNDCNKSLLPNGEDSNITDDPRWFINSYHNNSDHSAGKAFNVTQKRGTNISVDTQPTGDTQDSVVLKYSGTLPYKTTMQTEATSWLIYKKYDAEATTAEFEVELNKGTDSSSWAGVSEEDVSNTNVVDTTTRTNRRSMW